MAPLTHGCTDNFIPESVDTAKPGTVEVKKGNEITNVIVERASSQVCRGLYHALAYKRC